MKNFKRKNGITLIALVITIIIMMILVAVTVTMTINSGLFDYAAKASVNTKIAKQDEQTIAEGAIEVDGKQYDSPKDYINGIESKPKYSEDLLDENGVLTINAIYKDSNKKTVEIPKGFKVSTNSLEKNVADGLVILDKDGNEFVWVPVDFTKNNEDENKNDLDDGFEQVFYRNEWTRNYRVEEITSNFSDNYKEDESNDPTGKYKEMMLSVQEHKGFFVGRYEAGKTDNNQLVVKRDQKPYTDIQWGISMTDIGTNGAVYLSLNMYTGEDYGVVSTLCYGIQWDAMLDFIIKDDNGVHNVITSTDWGNYSNTNANKWKITRRTAKYYKNNTWNEINEDLTKDVAGNVKLTTGANDNFMAKNIYDVAGNCWEWTMEEFQNYYRVDRGGAYYKKGISAWGNGSPASCRDYGITGPAYTSDTYSFRVTLYVK